MLQVSVTTPKLKDATSDFNLSPFTHEFPARYSSRFPSTAKRQNHRSLEQNLVAFDKERTPVTTSMLIPAPNAAKSNELGSLFTRQLNDCIMFRKWPCAARCHSDRWPVNYSHRAPSPDISPDTLRRRYALQLCQRCATALRARV